MICVDTPSDPLVSQQSLPSGVTRCHALPGRLRLAVSGMKRDHALCAAAVAAARSLPGVRHAEGSIWTGRVLICYDPQVLAAEEVEAAVAVARAEEISGRSAAGSGTNGHHP